MARSMDLKLLRFRLAEILVVLAAPAEDHWRARSSAADGSAVGVGDGEGGAVEGRVPARFVHDVMVEVAQEDEVHKDGGAAGEGDDVVDVAVGAVAAGISAPAAVSEQDRSSESA